MKKLQFAFSLLMLVSFLASCKTDKTAETNTTEAANENSFGAGVTNQANPVALAEVVKQLDTQDSVNVVVKAKVGEVCQVKGCWMSLKDSQGGTSEELMVKFKDYAFFVPKDIAGREVLIEGVAYKEETSVEELRHYAEDAKKSPEEIAAITEPAVEKKFMATGVVLISDKAN